MRDICQLGVTSATLSDWQARALDDQEQQRIGQHVLTCAVCQQRIDRFARIAGALRAPVAEPAEQAIWRSLRGRILMHERGAMNRTQKFVTLGGLGIMAVVITIFALIFAALPNRPAVSVTATATVSSNSTGTPATPKSTPVTFTGWQLTNVMQSPISIAFSASSPLTGYLCGVNLALTIPGPNVIHLSLSITQDGGHSWGALLPLPDQDFSCAIAVNPTDARDVVLTELSCDFGCTGIPPVTYYRSRDGGNTWQHLLVPQAANSAQTANQPANVDGPPGGILSYAWVGATLYVIGISYAANNPDELYRTVNGAPLAQVNLASDSTVAAMLHNNPIGYEVFSLGNAVDLPLSGKCSPNCPFLTSHDNGATWQSFTPTIPGLLTTVQAAADGKTLLSNVSDTNRVLTSVRSRDGGHTWQTFPALPVGYSLNYTSIAASTPDGTLFLKSEVSTDDYVFRLAPGANTWTPEYARHLLSQSEAYPMVAAVSANANGQPQIIWGILEHSVANQIVVQLYQRPV